MDNSKKDTVILELNIYAKKRIVHAEHQSLF